VDGINIGFWFLQLTLTGPVAQNSTFPIKLEVSDPTNVAVPPIVVLTSADNSGSVAVQVQKNFVNPQSPIENVTITATGKRAIRFATLQIQQDIAR